MKHGTPLFLRPQVDEVLGVEKAGVVRTLVWPPNLTHDLGHFRKLCEDDAGLVHDANALTRPGTGRERAPSPDRAFIQVW